MIIVIHSVSLLFSLAAIYIMDKKAGLTNLIAFGIFIWVVCPEIGAGRISIETHAGP